MTKKDNIKEELRKIGIKEISIKILITLLSGWSSRIFYKFITLTDLMTGPHPEAEVGDNAQNTLVPNC